ncbi:MAG: NfeD family protein [Bacteroidales bacterium]|nr:NfeD family protein [Bacteroidales bacterium]MCI7051280.1 NfeD family protein [Bacteroidales bacterium]MDD6731586.1 NfeD family protein [Bacteroidales bacterium]MDY4558227.1 NfeD family protein [Alloprevotella sp.]
MTLILILAALALVLAFVEIVIVPGFGLAGMGAILCALIDVVIIYSEHGLLWAVVAIVAALAVLGLMLWWVSRSRTMDKMALHTSIDSTNATPEQLSVRVGDVGTALTRLALVGNAEIGGKTVEVKSSGAFINPGTPIRVVRVNEANITVEAIG